MSSFLSIRTGSRFSIVAMTATALVAGCELVASSDLYQCSTDGDCAARGGGFSGTTCVNRVCVAARPDATSAEGGGGQADAGADATGDASQGDAGVAADSPWGCLGQVTWPPQSTSETVLYRNRLVQLSSKAPVVGLQVTACGSLDPACRSPIATTTTDDQGYFDLTVPRWFRGFFMMATPPPSYPDMVPALIMALPPPSESADPDAGIPTDKGPVLPTAADLDALLSLVGRQLPGADAGMGELLGLATDCQGNPAAGVSLQTATTVPNQTLPYYIGADGVPSTTDQQTSAAGQCGFVSLPQGDDTITMALFGQGQRVGQVPLLIQSGFVTISLLPPTP